MDHDQFLRDFTESLGRCGAPFGVRISVEEPGSGCKHFRVVASVEGGRLYVSFVYPTNQTYQVVTNPSPNVQMHVITATDHLSVVFDDPLTQVVYELVDDREAGIEVCASQRGAFVGLQVHAPSGSRLEKSRQMPTAVSHGWVDQIAVLHGFVRNRDVTECARRRNMIYRHEISTAAESLGMMTSDAARRMGWVSPDDLGRFYEYVGPTDEEYNAALVAWEATLKPTADSNAEVLEAQVEEISAAAAAVKVDELAHPLPGDGPATAAEAVAMGAAAPVDGSASADADGHGVTGASKPGDMQS